MRENLKRVTIVLTKDQHERFKDYAKKYHGSVSQFIRLAAENAINEDFDKIDFRLRPVFEQLEKMNLFLKNSYNQLNDIQKGTNFLVEKAGSKVEKIASDVEKLLINLDKPLSIPEIAGYLPYEQENLIFAVEHLEEQFAVAKQNNLNAPSKWKIRGDKDA